MIKIYTDGSSRGNPGPGGYAAVVYDSTHNELINFIMQQDEYITNNQGELKALLFALKMTQEYYGDETCIIYSDSAYCVNMCNSWIYNWATNGWMNSKKQQVENYELVKMIYKYLEKPNKNFDIQKIPGHRGDIGNELADALASNNLLKFKSIIKQNNINYNNDKVINDIFENL